MPHTRGLIERGVMGDLATLVPTISPMLWNSIATGKRADQHGILGFSEIDPTGGEVRPVTSLSRRTKAFWNILSQTGRRVRVVNWFGSHPAEPVNGVCVSDAFTRGTDQPGVMPSLAPGTVHPASRSAEVARLRVGVREIDGQMLTLFVPRAVEVDQNKDHHLAELARELAKSASIHAAITQLMAEPDWDLAAVYYPSIDLICHAFMEFHPPKLPGVPPKLFELYHDVVNSAYRFHDLMLGRLLQLAGPDTTVLLLSDHGFHSDHLRPRHIPDVPAGIVVQHRGYGIIVIAGPGIKRDERIYGLNLLDVTPTLLSLLGIPVARDMEGRVLAEAFSSPPQPDWIESWEAVAGNAGQHSPGAVLHPEDETVLLNQLVALGYLDPLESDAEKARAQTRRENNWNLARVHLATGRLDRAISLLEDLCLAWPERTDMMQALAECLRRIGFHEQARSIAEAIIANDRDTPSARYLLGITALEAGSFKEALTCLTAAEPAFPQHPDLLIRLGIAYQKLGDAAAAERAFRRASEVDTNCASAWLGLAGCAFSDGRWSEALNCAVRAASLDFQLARAHWTAGLVFWREGQIDRAIQALETAVRVNPSFLLPHRLLVRLWLTQPGGLDHAVRHKEAWLTGRKLRAELERRQQEMLTAARQEAWRRIAELQAQWSRKQALPIAGQTSVAHSGQALRPVKSLDLHLVSGLPRSGTSLVMQMLRAGGVPVLADGRREADEDNPEGYFEWDPIKQLQAHPERLREAEGKVVKVISALLAFLPRRHTYRIILLDRSIDEILASQLKMIARRRPENFPRADPDRLATVLGAHFQSIQTALADLPSVQVLRLPFRELIARPDDFVPRLVEFMTPLRVPYPDRMVHAVRPQLYRNRLGQRPEAA